MTFKGLINAEYSFGVLGDKVKELWDKVTASDGFASVWDKILSLVDRVPGIAITCILLALSLVQVFAGKRLLSIQKFLAFFFH